MKSIEIGALLKANIDAVENVRASWVQEMFALINELVRRADAPTQPASAPAREGAAIEPIIEWIRNNYQDHSIDSLCEELRAQWFERRFDTPAAPAQPREAQAELVGKALNRAWQLGQTYWQQADSDSYKQNARAGVTKDMYEELRADTLAALAAPRAPSIEPVGHVIEVEEHVSGTWGQKRRVRCVVWTGEPPAVGEALFLRVALPTAPASAGVEEFPLPELPCPTFINVSPALGYTAEQYREGQRAALRSYSASLGLQARTEGTTSR